jgi:hypothetical protein
LWIGLLESQKNWAEALRIYMGAFSVDFKYNEGWIGSSIRNLGRILKALGESQFDALWQEVIGGKCPEELRSAIWAARDRLETES